MKKILLIMVALVATIYTFAQGQDSIPGLRIGIVSLDSAMHSMQEWKQMELTIANQKAQYERELSEAADEFNAKYETFLLEQKDYAPSILRKRQSELEELVKRNEQFKQESLKNLDYARTTLLQPIQQKLQEAIHKVSEEEHLTIVLNQDNNSLPYFNPTTTINITDKVITTLTPNP